MGKETAEERAARKAAVKAAKQVMVRMAAFSGNIRRESHACISLC